MIETNHHQMMYNLRNKEEYIKYGDYICQRTIQFLEELTLFPFKKITFWICYLRLTVRQILQIDKITLFYLFAKSVVLIIFSTWFFSQNNVHFFLKFWSSLLFNFVLYLVFLGIWGSMSLCRRNVSLAHIHNFNLCIDDQFIFISNVPDKYKQ